MGGKGQRTEFGCRLEGVFHRAAVVERQPIMKQLPIAKERRKGERFGISAPLTVFLDSREVPGFTQNLSNQGVFFHLDLADNAALGGEFKFQVEMPPEITLSTRCLVECQGRVVRIEKTSGQFMGVAAEILHYSIERGAAA
jgi:hypothetical protein